MQLPLTRFTLRDPDTNKNKFVKSNMRSDCIQFIAVRGLLIVELLWNSADEFDLSLTEPGGNVINNRNLRSVVTGGRLIADHPGIPCTVIGAGREEIVYRTRSPPLRGLYKIEVRHFLNCRPGVDTSSFSVTVIVDGRAIFFGRDESSAGTDALVLSATFVI